MYEQALDAARRIGKPFEVENHGPAAARGGAVGASEALRQEIGSARSVHQRMVRERQLNPVRAAMSAAEFEQAWDEGGAMSLEDAIQVALDERAGHDS